MAYQDREGKYHPIEQQFNEFNGSSLNCSEPGGTGSIGLVNLKTEPPEPPKQPDSESNGTTAGTANDDKRHVSIEPESGRENGSKRKVGEHQSDHLSPSPASDAAASQTAPTIVNDGNVALSDGGRLTEAEVERFRHFRRKGLDGSIARARVLAERRA